MASKDGVNEEILQLRPRELAEFLEFCLSVRNHNDELCPLVPFVQGGIGIGKSSIVKQTARKMGINYIEYRTATQEPTDVSGVPMPDAETQSTVFFKPARLKELPMDWEGIVFLDEFTKAPLSVTNAWSQPVLDRCIDEMPLPVGLRFVVAGNRRYDKSSDNELAQFMLNRMTQVELVPDVEDTVAHFSDIGLRSDVQSFLKFGGKDYLWSYKPDSRVHATPRTWEMVARAVDLAVAQGKDTEDNIVLTAAVIGLVGKAAGTAYLQFHRMLTNMPNVREVVNNPTTTRVFDDNSTAYTLAMCLSRKATTDNVDKMLTYLARGNIEVTASFVSDALKRTPSLKEAPAMKEWLAKHKDIPI